MALPLRITFRDMSPSESVEAYVRRRAERLEKLSGRIADCHVTIEMPHRHHLHGRPFHVSVELRVPGGEIHSNHAREDALASLDAYAAIDRAFERAAHQLQRHLRIRRGEVKSHRQTSW